MSKKTGQLVTWVWDDDRDYKNTFQLNHPHSQVDAEDAAAAIVQNYVYENGTEDCGQSPCIIILEPAELAGRYECGIDYDPVVYATQDCFYEPETKSEEATADG